MENLIGLVLCGGKSSRMGKDKGLLTKGWQTWSQRAEDLLLQLGIPVYVSIRKTQLPEYKKFHVVESLIVDCVEAQGPLAGILSAHQQFPDCDMMVLANDMVYIQLPNMEHLLAMSCLNLQAEVVAYESNYLQTLCAVYKASFLQELLEKLNTGQLNSFSLQHLVRSAKLLRVPVKEQEEDLFRNCNYENDLYEPSH